MSVMNHDGTHRNIWKVDEVYFLFFLVKKHNVLEQLKHKFKSTEVYNKLEKEFVEAGYNRTGIQIRHKLKALKCSYNQAIKESIRNGTERPVCDFYEELDDLFKFRSLDLKCNATLESGHQGDQDHPAELVEILLKEEGGEEAVELVCYVEEPTQGDLSEGNSSEAIAGNSGLKRLETSDSGPPKKKRKELDGDHLLDKFLDYQKKADERAAKLFREAEERAQDRADSRMRESMAILSSTINSIFEKFQSQPNVSYPTHIPPSSVIFNFSPSPQGHIHASPYTPPSEAPSPNLNVNFHNSTKMHTHSKDHNYLPNS